MPRPWQIVDRANKTGLSVGSASGAIPGYVEPILLDFCVFAINGIPGATTAERGQEIQFLFHLADPDEVVDRIWIWWGDEMLPRQSWGAERADWVRHGDGWLAIGHACAIGGPEAPRAQLIGNWGGGGGGVAS